METSEKSAQVVRDHESLVWLGRAGWLAKGAVYGVLGLIAVAIALGDGGGGGGGESASQRGAIERIAASSGGAAVLWILAAGLVLYALWRLVSATLPGDDDAEAMLKRLGWVASAVIYLGLAFVAVSIATGARSEGGSGDEPLVERISSDLIASGWGRWLVAIGGLVAIGVGVYFAKKGWTESFTDQIRSGGVGPVSGELLRNMGKIGWIARGAVLIVVGIVVAVAAVQADPDEAKGLDGSLRDLAAETWGAVVVFGIGAGLVLYGAYAALSAPKRILSGP